SANVHVHVSASEEKPVCGVLQKPTSSIPFVFEHSSQRPGGVVVVVVLGQHTAGVNPGVGGGVGDNSHSPTNSQGSPQVTRVAMQSTPESTQSTGVHSTHSMLRADGVPHVEVSQSYSESQIY